MTHSPETLAAPLAVELTILTGEIWRTHKDDHRTAIYSDTAYLTLWTGYGMQGRIQINATAPRDMREPGQGYKITCAADRTPEAIARDIATRLLKDAKDHLSKCKAYDHEKRKEKAIETLRQRYIKKYLPEFWCRYSNDQPIFHRSNDWKTIRAQLTYENKVEITINLPFMEALKLLKHIQKNY